ncbi:MAG: hypothetical protein L6R40_000439 [Gallowayella cf. fulva]|nr:MAG: hypothetical protein L6R40_000439 [Xanthomendoza cf. fulva]
MSVLEIQANEREAAFLRKAYERQGRPEHVAMAREYLSAMDALDDLDDSANILKKASLMCLNSKRKERKLPPLTDVELDGRLDQMVTQIFDSVRDIQCTKSPEEIMERLNDELVGVTPAEREMFLVLDSWKVLERKKGLQDWSDWVLEAFDSGDLRSDFWGTEVKRERKDLIGFLLGETGGEDIEDSTEVTKGTIDRET